MAALTVRLQRRRRLQAVPVGQRVSASAERLRSGDRSGMRHRRPGSVERTFTRNVETLAGASADPTASFKQHSAERQRLTIWLSRSSSAASRITGSSSGGATAGVAGALATEIAAPPLHAFAQPDLSEGTSTRRSSPCPLHWPCMSAPGRRPCGATQITAVSSATTTGALLVTGSPSFRATCASSSFDVKGFGTRSCVGSKPGPSAMSPT